MLLGSLLISSCNTIGCIIANSLQGVDLIELATKVLVSFPLLYVLTSD